MVLEEENAQRYSKENGRVLHVSFTAARRKDHVTEVRPIGKGAGILERVLN